MTRLHRFVSSLVLVCFTFSATGVAHAQSAPAYAAVGVPIVLPQAPAAAGEDSMSAGMLDGQMLAERKGTGGKLATGVGIGLLTGLIGTGIGYFVVGADEPSAELVMRGQGRSADYQLGLRTGWEKRMKSKKCGVFLGDGLRRTSVWIAIVGRVVDRLRQVSC